jgi:mono/diheme cytochrome c family protein
MKTKNLILTMMALAATTAALSAADVTANWEKSCQKCHGADGKGQTPTGKRQNIKDFTDAKYQDSFKDADAAKAIKEGFKVGDSTKMQPFDALTDAEIKDLVAKVRSYKPKQP